MRIALIAPIVEPVPPPTYGGIELVITNLDEQLTSQGHEVILLASGDSHSHGTLVPLFPKALRTYDEAKNQYWQQEMKVLAIANSLKYLRNNPVDIVHSHLDWKFLPFEALISAPVITTIHGYPGSGGGAEVYEQYSESNFVSISLAQRMSLPALHYTANIYNGVDTSEFTFFPEPQDYFSFLGRMSPEKGPVEAIAIAKKAGVKLIMAAKIDVSDQDFYNTKVKPLIDGKQIQYIGEVGHAEKLKLLGNSCGLIAPIQWEEPFGLFFIEAMACGTPVITMHRGSAPEIITHQETGFVCKSIEEAALAVQNIESISRKKCFDHVQVTFSAKTMATNYVQAYTKVLNGISLKS